MKTFSRKTQGDQRQETVVHGSIHGKCDRCCHLKFKSVSPLQRAAVCGLNSQPLGNGMDTTTPQWCPMNQEW